MRRVRPYCAGLAIACLSATSAFAQTTGAAGAGAGAGQNDSGTVSPTNSTDPENDQRSTIGEGDIVVTAQRRSERLQDIPATISAFSSAAVRDAGVVSIADVAPRVPGFYFGGFGTSRPQLYIRGVGTRQFDPGSESSVGVFVDESYLGRTGGVLGALKDIERVEVLKGPQGTLYGRNTIAGAINVITKAPTEDFQAEAEAGYGNYNTYELFGAVSGPIVEDKVLFRAAGWRTYSRGYVTNLTTGNHAQGTDNYGGRVRLEFRPSSSLKIGLIGEALRDTGPSFQGESIGTTANPNSILLGRAGLVPRRSSDPFKQYYTTDPDYRRTVYSGTGKIEWDVGVGSFVSVTAYRHLKFRDDRDFDNTSLDVIRQISDEKSSQFTQELRFVSDRSGALSLGGKLDWIVGLYYYRDTSTHSDLFRFGLDSIVFPTGRAQTDVTFGDYKTNSYAAFGQATLHITDKLELTAGARYTSDEKKATLGATTTDTLPLVPAAFTVPGLKRKFSSFDPRVVLSYQPSRDVNIYASYGQGFKSGGFQYTSLTAAQASQIFDPESLNAYEIGIKTNLIGRTLTANAAIYQYDYSNIQVSRVVQLGTTTPSLITNAAASRIRGGELELSMRPTEGLTFDLAYAYTDAKYRNYIFNATQNFSGTRMVRAPEHSINVSGQWEVPLGSETSVVFRGDYALLSTFFHEPGQGEARFGLTTALTREPGYGLGNARVTLRHGNYRLSGYVNNVGNILYRRTILALPNQVINYYGLPRTYGLTVGASF